MYELQIIAHFIGDYVLQSGWMATQKTKRTIPALVHVLVYSLPFLVLVHPTLAAYAVIVGTHFFIDRFALARYVAYAKEFLAPPSKWKTWDELKQTGFSKETPVHLSTWLLIIIDNTIHVSINAAALFYL